MINIFSFFLQPFTRGISFFSFNIIYTAVVLGIANLTFFKALFKATAPEGFILSAVCFFLAFLSIHALLFWRPVTKILAGFFLIGNAVASYFISTYNILLNKIMLMNVVDTNMTEACDFFNASFFGYVFWTGVLPLILLFFLKITYAPFPKELAKRLLLIAISLSVIAGVALPQKKELKVFLRENFNLRYQLVPTSYVSSAIGVFNILFIKKAVIDDVTKGFYTTRYWKQDGKKNLIVFVLGESARDANFSLSGYNRDTNAPLTPYLKDLSVFHKTVSCGVVTRVSLPCMFSHYKRTEFQDDRITYTENVLDLIKRAGYNVTWIENEIGCSKVCRRIETLYTCQDRDCYDERLNDTFKAAVPNLDNDAVFVLHQRGSHGPLYHQRYPKAFERYSPVCQTGDIGRCRYDELVNAYDNTLYYTSFLLADLMAYLSTLTDRFNPVLIYISDHGESLGEERIMLHGGDWEDAPDYQKQVPFLIWMPAESRAAFGLNQACLTNQTATQRSHDYIFHSLLGLSGVFVDVYDKTLDLFTPCREQMP